MVTEHRAVAPLRVFLVVLFAILVMFQTVSLPGQFAHLAEEEPEQAYLRWPLTLVSVFWVLCIQVVIVATWKLLTMVKNDRIFSEASLAWVDAIVWAIGAAWLALPGLGLYLVVTRGTPEDPGAPLLLFLLSIGVAVLGLLMVVMRALLRQATTLRTDLEAVI
ncbi:MAG: DUF2975 domain-containing protein [Sporichthyaceae bacterium]